MRERKVHERGVDDVPHHDAVERFAPFDVPEHDQRADVAARDEPLGGEGHFVASRDALDADHRRAAALRLVGRGLKHGLDERGVELGRQEREMNGLLIQVCRHRAFRCR